MLHRPTAFECGALPNSPGLLWRDLAWKAFRAAEDFSAAIDAEVTRRAVIPKERITSSVSMAKADG